jgi:hypothetical protein
VEGQKAARLKPARFDFRIEIILAFHWMMPGKRLRHRNEVIWFCQDDYFNQLSLLGSQWRLSSPDCG